MWALAPAPGRPDYPVVNYSEPLCLFLLASRLAISQLIDFALRTGGNEMRREKPNPVV